MNSSFKVFSDYYWNLLNQDMGDTVEDSLNKLNKKDLINIITEQRKFRKLEIPLYKGYDEVISASN